MHTAFIWTINNTDLLILLPSVTMLQSQFTLYTALNIKIICRRINAYKATSRTCEPQEALCHLQTLWWCDRHCYLTASAPFPWALERKYWLHLWWPASLIVTIETWEITQRPWPATAITNTHQTRQTPLLLRFIKKAQYICPPPWAIQII